ncbi:MAG TPA: hypothetical protein VF955_09610, partial [Pyrinomonadaceae bacterium]
MGFELTIERMRAGCKILLIFLFQAAVVQAKAKLLYPAPTAFAALIRPPLDTLPFNEGIWSTDFNNSA